MKANILDAVSFAEGDPVYSISSTLAKRIRAVTRTDSNSKEAVKELYQKNLQQIFDDTEMTAEQRRDFCNLLDQHTNSLAQKEWFAGVHKELQTSLQPEKLEQIFYKNSSSEIMIPKIEDKIDKFLESNQINKEHLETKGFKVKDIAQFLAASNQPDNKVPLQDYDDLPLKKYQEMLPLANGNLNGKELEFIGLLNDITKGHFHDSSLKKIHQDIGLEWGQKLEERAMEEMFSEMASEHNNNSTNRASVGEMAEGLAADKDSIAQSQQREIIFGPNSSMYRLLSTESPARIARLLDETIKDAEGTPRSLTKEELLQNSPKELHEKMAEVGKALEERQHKRGFKQTVTDYLDKFAVAVSSLVGISQVPKELAGIKEEVQQVLNERQTNISPDLQQQARKIGQAVEIEATARGRRNSESAVTNPNKIPHSVRTDRGYSF